MKAIPLNTQKFKAIYINKLIFLDSMSFADGSLAKLADTLKLSNYDFPILKQWNRLKKEDVLSARDYPWIPGEGGEEEDCYVEKVLSKRLSLSDGKQTYPHEWNVNGVQQLLFETRLPPKEGFYSRLTDDEPTDEEYQKAQEVWNVFDCENMLDFTSVYVEVGEGKKKRRMSSQ